MTFKRYWIDDPRDAEDQIPLYLNPPACWLEWVRHRANIIAYELADSRGLELIKVDRWHDMPDDVLEDAYNFWHDVWEAMPSLNALRWRIELREVVEPKLMSDVDNEPPSFVDARLFYGIPNGGPEVVARRILLDIETAYSVVDTPMGSLTVVQLALKREAETHNIPADAFNGLSFSVPVTGGQS